MTKVNIAILGDIRPDYEPHCEMDKFFRDRGGSLTHEWIPTGSLEKGTSATLSRYNGIVAGSGPYHSKTGIINGIRYARESNTPFLGTCSGFGYAVLESGQSIFKLEEVYHPYERDDLSPTEIFLEQLAFCSPEMHTVSFAPAEGSLTQKIYNDSVLVHERSHCYYGINKQMVDAFRENGLIISGADDHGEAKIMEYTKNNFFVITLFLPQLNLQLTDRHPLLNGFLDAARTTAKTHRSSHWQLRQAE